MANRVKERLAQGKVVTGPLIVSPSVEMIQTLAVSGFDYVVIDQMYGAITWNDAANMVKAAKLSGITPIVRLEAEPWAVVDNPQVAVDAGRALSVGFEGILYSVTTANELKRLLTVVDRAWHRDLHTIPWSKDQFAAHLKKIREDTFIGVLVESQTAYDNVDEIAATEGIDAVFAATTDLTIEFTGGINSDNPKTWAAIDRLAKLSKKNGVAFWANTGMGYTTFPEMVSRGQQLVDRGANMILFQTAELVLQMGGKHLLSEFAKSLEQR